MEMAKYILSILSCDLSIVLSWGFHRPVGLENGLKFNVNGFKHKGIVKVLYNEGADLFEIEIINSENQLVEKIERVYFDQLVEVIDNHVELIENYYEAVRKEYAIIDSTQNDNK